jgi:hypothetical protein
MKTVDLRSVALVLLAGGVLLVLGPSSAKANTFTFSTGTVGSGDNARDASATVTTNAGSITVLLTNNIGGADLRASGQALSDFHFVLSVGPGAVSMTGTGNTETLTGTPVTATQVGSTSLTHWVVSNPSGGTVNMTTLSGGQPNQMIIGAPDASGAYTNGNNGLKNFNDYVNTTGSFTITAPNVTTGTTIDAASVTFSFGTGPDSIVSAVPEPGPLLGAGVVTLLGLGYTWRRRRQASA